MPDIPSPSKKRATVGMDEYTMFSTKCPHECLHLSIQKEGGRPRLAFSITWVGVLYCI